MCHPGAVEAVAALALLVFAHASDGSRIDLGVLPAGDECRHAADRVRPPLVAHVDQPLRVGAHERHRHRELHAVRQHLVRARAERLDEAEQVVPPSGVQPRRMFAQLVQDLLHLERGGQRLDEHRRADGTARNAERLLRREEDVVPQACLEMVLELGQVEVRATATSDQLGGVVEEVQAKIHQARRCWRVVDAQVPLLEVPPARADHERCRAVVQAVRLAVGVEGQLAADRVAQVLLPLHHVGPRRRAGILEVRHEHLRAGVERVDHHLAVHGPGDLHPPVVQVGRGWRDRPLRGSHAGRGRREVERRARRMVRELLTPRRSGGQQLLAARVEPAMEVGHEAERPGGEDRVVVRAAWCGEGEARGK